MHFTNEHAKRLGTQILLTQRRVKLKTNETTKPENKTLSQLRDYCVNQVRMASGKLLDVLLTPGMCNINYEEITKANRTLQEKVEYLFDINQIIIRENEAAKQNQGARL